MLKKILYGLLGLVALIVVVSMFLPGTVHVERSIQMDAPAAKIFPMVNDLRSWEKWSPWFEIDPSMEMTWGDKTSGVGASYCWKGDPDKSGTGCLEITESIENISIRTKIDFNEQGTAEGGWQFEESDCKTQVTWGFDTDVSSPMVIGKFFGLMMDGFVGPDFEKGLEKMRSYVETTPEYSIEIAEASMGPVHYIFVRSTTTYENLGQQMGEASGIMGAYMAKNGIEKSGNVFAEYFTFGEEIDFAFCISIAGEIAVDHEQVQYGLLDEGKYMRGIHLGPYENLKSSYDDMERYMIDQCLESTSGPIEVYITDPGEEPDPANWITHINFPIGG